MSETTNLKLFKHDDPVNNTGQFDVEKSLNENWDKIDDFAEKVNDKVIEIEDNIEELDINTANKIADLQAENERLREDLKGMPSRNSRRRKHRLNR